VNLPLLIGKGKRYCNGDGIVPMRAKYFSVLLMLLCCGLVHQTAQADTVTYDIPFDWAAAPTFQVHANKYE